MRFPAPPNSFPTKDEMADYLEAYAAHFALPVRMGVKVDRLFSKVAAMSSRPARSGSRPTRWWWPWPAIKAAGCPISPARSTRP